MNLLDIEPMMSLDKFIEETGLSAVTVWRYRRKGMLATVNICGRHYILRAEIARFNQRAAAGPVYEYGEQGYDRVLAMADNDGQAWLLSHKQRAERLIWLFYALAFLSAIALIAPVKWPGLSIWFSLGVLVLGAITLGSGGYIAYAGGRIRHREFRNEVPPKGVPETAGAVPSPAVQPAGRRSRLQRQQ